VTGAGGCRLGPALAGLVALLALGCRVPLHFAGQDGEASPPAPCASDQDCPLSSLHCDPVIGSCFACVNDGNCSTIAGRPRCDTAHHLCVQCGTGGDCQTGWRCLVGTCVQSCATVADCTTAGMHCDDGICEQCDDSRGCSGATAFCNPTTRQCVGCVVDAQCAAPTPRCNPSNGRCVGCLTGSDCPAGSVCLPGDWICEVVPS